MSSVTFDISVQNAQYKWRYMQDVNRLAGGVVDRPQELERHMPTEWHTLRVAGEESDPAVIALIAYLQVKDHKYLLVEAKGLREKYLRMTGVILPDHLSVDQQLCIISTYGLLRKRSLIISAADIITVDCIDHDGAYITGYKLPSAYNIAALVQRSVGATPGSLAPQRQQDAPSDIKNDEWIMVVGAIERINNQLSAKWEKDYAILVTGADGPTLRNLIRHTINRSQYRFELALDGLNY